MCFSFVWCTEAYLKAWSTKVLRKLVWPSKIESNKEVKLLDGKLPQDSSTPQKAEPKVEARCESQDTSQGLGTFSSSKETKAAMTLKLNLRLWRVGVYLHGMCMSVCVENHPPIILILVSK